MKIYLPILLLLPVAVIVFLFLLPFILLVDLLALLFGRFFWLTRLSFRIFEMFFAFFIKFKFLYFIFCKSTFWSLINSKCWPVFKISNFLFNLFNSTINGYNFKNSGLVPKIINIFFFIYGFLTFCINLLFAQYFICFIGLTYFFLLKYSHSIS